MSAKRVMTDFDVSRARRLRRNGKSYDAIGEVFNVTADTIRRYLEPDYRDHRNMQAASHRKRERESNSRFALGIPHHQNEPRVRVVPAEVIADAMARRFLSHPTLTAAFCGDPLPGRSALAQRDAPERPKITLAGPRL